MRDQLQTETSRGLEHQRGAAAKLKHRLERLQIKHVPAEELKKQLCKKPAISIRHMAEQPTPTQLPTNGSSTATVNMKSSYIIYS
ncbi:hypothetical protein D5086_024658 [Populus alba]|uniref:Uncharacterized protein n=2 Tax=Populus TaxID=3689 RepID=A0ACC4B6Q9_POPAL|nr:hypothetical protein NC653_030072 [Populus alba x Populus x berolinensis]KAJ6976167.1 hypothetical protein NC653_031871 [Populus alba x Populus x berolinensis]KAJ6976174.1 hypothetical protein NC653_031878 [Populus alba x Populus x berolinensis]KAJ6976180.1 hypothetical protein NC653_031884 [Populus alba x Populus x berolinensis]KAJ6976185.1 hypothetical protein NC653_031889 [Populus alba x Populus x berolinensis]